MQARERMIRARFAEHVCGHCGTHYTPESVLVLARRRSAWMVMASCPHCQRHGLFVVSFPEQSAMVDGKDAHEEPAIYPNTFLPPSSAQIMPPPPTFPSASLPNTPQAPFPTLPTHPTLPTLPSLPPSPSPPVTAADVNEMHDFLARFSGDFRSLFAGPRNE